MEEKINHKKRKSLGQEVAENTIWNIFLVLVTKLGSLILTIVLARILLPEKYGIYSLVLSITLVIFTFTDLGINTALSRYVSDSLSKKNKKKAAAYFKYLLKVKILLTETIALILLILAYPLSFYIFKKPALLLPLIISSFYLFFLSILSFLETLFYVFRKVKYLAFKEVAYEVLKISFIITALFLLVSVYKVFGVFLALLLSTIFILFLVLYLVKKIAPFLFIKTKIKIDKKRIFKFISYLTITSVSGVFFAYIDTIMIGIFIADASYVGYYRAALSFVFTVAALLTFSNIVLPALTQTKKKDLERLFNKILQYTALISIPAAFGVLVLGRYFIRAIYGYSYLPGIYPLYFLSFLIVGIPISSLFTTLFSSQEKPKYYAWLTIIASILNIILNYFLIIYFLRFSETCAITAVAFTTFFTRLFFLIVVAGLTKKILKISIHKIFLLNPLIASILMAAILFTINRLFIKDMNLLTGVVEIFLGMLIYFLLIFSMKGITRKDINFFKSLRPL